MRGDPTKWESEINDTETMITSCKDRERWGNLCGEILRELLSLSLLLCFLKLSSLRIILSHNFLICICRPGEQNRTKP